MPIWENPLLMTSFQEACLLYRQHSPSSSLARTLRTAACSAAHKRGAGTNGETLPFGEAVLPIKCTTHLSANSKHLGERSKDFNCAPCCQKGDDAMRNLNVIKKHPYHQVLEGWR